MVSDWHRSKVTAGAPEEVVQKYICCGDNICRADQENIYQAFNVHIWKLFFKTQVGIAIIDNFAYQIETFIVRTLSIHIWHQ